MKTSAKSLVVLAAAALACLAAAQTPFDKTVVVVNGEEIKAGKYYKRMEVLPGVGRMSEGRFMQAAPGFLTLQQMINETLMLQLAKKKGVAPTDAQVNAEVKERLADNPKLLEAFAAAGMAEEDLRYDVRVQLAQFNVQTMGINIADLEVEKFYKENPTIFTTPKRYKLRVIAVASDEKKASVDAALKAGKAFADVAKEFSEDLSKATGGDVGEVAVTQLAEAVKTAIEGAGKGKATDWIKADNSSIRFFVEDVLPEKVQPYDEKLKRDLRKRLMMDRGGVRNNVAEMMKQMAAEAKIDCPGTLFGEQIKRSFGRTK